MIGQRLGWQVKRITLIGGTLGSVHVNAFEETLEELGVKKKAWTTMRKAHVRRLLEAQDGVLLAYYGGLYGGDQVAMRQHLGHDIYG